MLCDAVAIQSSAEPLRSLAHLSLLVHRPCFTSPTPASPLRFCARRLFTLPFHRASIHLNAIAKQCFASHSSALAFLCAATLYFAIPSRFDSSQCHCQTMLRLSFLRPCVSVRGDSLLCHSFAIPCQTVLCLASATHCSTQPCRCFSGRIEATHFDTQPSRVTVSQYFAFAMRNISQRLRCSTSSVSTFPLRCRDTHRPAKPLLFFWFQNRTQPALCSS